MRGSIDRAVGHLDHDRNGRRRQAFIHPLSSTAGVSLPNLGFAGACPGRRRFLNGPLTYPRSSLYWGTPSALVHRFVRVASLFLVLVSALHCGNGDGQSPRGDSSAGAAGTAASSLDAGYGGSGSGELDGGAGPVGSAGTISVDPPSGAFDGGACESSPAPLLRPECPDAPRVGEPCEPAGLPCLYEDSKRSDCFRLFQCSHVVGWSEHTVCREETSQPANDERCPERGPVEGEPCELADLVCDFGPCGDGKLVMQCECGRWKTLQGCVFL